MQPWYRRFSLIPLSMAFVLVSYRALAFNAILLRMRISSKPLRVLMLWLWLAVLIRLECASFFALLSGGVSELGLHASYAARWDIDLTTVTPSAATLAYTDFLLATAGLRDVGEICAALAPCMRLYAFWGSSCSLF